jgi:hypothetical protein
MDGPVRLIRKTPANWNNFWKEPYEISKSTSRYKVPTTSESQRDSCLPPGITVGGRKGRWNTRALDAWPKQQTKKSGGFTSAYTPKDKTLSTFKTVEIKARFYLWCHISYHCLSSGTPIYPRQTIPYNQYMPLIHGLPFWNVIYHSSLSSGHSAVSSTSNRSCNITHSSVTHFLNFTGSSFVQLWNLVPYINLYHPGIPDLNLPLQHHQQLHFN